MAISGLVALPDVGSLIAGKFKLEELIGEGGQAWIWRARHVELDSDVALKILRTAVSDLTQIERIREEARSVARLNHPSIVRVFDLGETPEGNPYFAMEHLEGENLAEALVRTGRMTPIGAVRLLLPIASAIAAVHAIGIVHRDVKPDNVFLAQGPHGIQPKLLDFGVAKHDSGSQRPAKLTDVGAVLGSPAYLSPEQARGQSDVDCRADIWAFCAMLYECVTGSVPFQAPNTHALLFSITEDAPASFGDLGLEEDELWQIVRRGLEKSPEDRWPNMRTLGRALAQWLTDRNVSSDVTGVVLESTWFNPELVTPPPLSPRRLESVGGDGSAWTKHSFAESHIESRPIEPTKRKRPHQDWTLVLTLLGSMAAGGVLFAILAAETPLVEHSSALLGVGAAPAPDSIKLLEPNGAPPHRLDSKLLVRDYAALYPGLPYALAPLPIVPVEKLLLVSGPSGGGAALQSPSRAPGSGVKNAPSNGPQAPEALTRALAVDLGAPAHGGTARVPSATAESALDAAPAGSMRPPHAALPPATHLPATPARSVVPARPAASEVAPETGARAPR